ELRADLQSIVAGAGKNDRLGAESFRDRNGHQPDGARAGDANTFAGHKPAKFGKRIHCGSGGNDEGTLFVCHLVRDHTPRVDVFPLVFAEAAISGETIGAMALVNITIIETVVVAGRIHTFAATFALPAAGMNLDRHARADLVFIDAGPER